MAKAPLICQADLANTLIEGGHFDKCTLLVTKDSTVVNSFNFCDFSLDIDEFFTQNLTLGPGSAFLLDDGGLSNSFGEVKFLLIKVSYPTTFTRDSDKYIDLIHESSTYSIGELHIWTGNPGDSAGMGIAVSPSGDPQYSTGGIVLHNPHTNSVSIKIIVASSASQGVSTNTGTSGTSGTSGTGGNGTSGTSGSSGTSGVIGNADYNGTSGSLITIL
jgi:uncharacterized membrane protein YgcG